MKAEDIINEIQEMFKAKTALEQLNEDLRRQSEYLKSANQKYEQIVVSLTERLDKAFKALAAIKEHAESVR